MGRVISQTYCIPQDCSYSVSVKATYDLAGNLTSLTYPSTRTVTYGYDAADRLTSVTYASFGQTSVGYTYYTAQSFWPSGQVRQAQYGNGVYEMTDQNSRLQADGFTVASTTSPSSSNPAFMQLGLGMYDPTTGGNNGNVWSIANYLNGNRTQTFNYDALNRLTYDAEADPSGWGEQRTFDAWGNINSWSLLKGSLVAQPVSANANNRLTVSGINYDAAGNVITNGTMQFQYDAENRIIDVGNQSPPMYTYDADGMRAEKNVGGDKTDYVYFGGEPIAEYHNTPSGYAWDDYIFAGSKRIAMSPTSKSVLQTSGTYCTNCGWQWSTFMFPQSVIPYHRTVQIGDKLFLTQVSNQSSAGGIEVTFSDGTNTWNPAISDTAGRRSDADPVMDWHTRTIDLSSFAGKQVQGIYLVTEGLVSGYWEIQYVDVSYAGADGTVWPLFTGTDPGLSIDGSSQSSRSYVVYTDNTFHTFWSQRGTRYYHSDQIGSARLISSYGGGPVWQGTFTPFGYEVSAQATVSHYKFSGKERDAETGLDYFGARYYASSMGRWMSPDWAAKPTTVPYANFGDPQSLNLYQYVGNNPLSHVDKDGHFCSLCGIAQTVLTYVYSHPAVRRALGRVVQSLSVKGNAGFGVQSPKGLPIHASLTGTGYFTESGQGLSVGLNATALGRVGPAGGQVSVAVPMMKNGEAVNPLKSASVSAAPLIAGERGKGEIAGLASKNETSVGGTYGEGVVGGLEVGTSSHALQDLGGALIGAVMSDVQQAVGNLRNMMSGDIMKQGQAIPACDSAADCK